MATPNSSVAPHVKLGCRVRRQPVRRLTERLCLMMKTLLSSLGRLVHNCFIKCEEWKTCPNHRLLASPAAHRSGFPPPHGGRLCPGEDSGPKLHPRRSRSRSRAAACGLAASPAGREGHLSLYIWKPVGVFICWEVWVPSPGGAGSQSGQRTQTGEGTGVGRPGWG